MRSWIDLTFTLLTKHRFMGFSPGSTEWLECRVCVGEGKEMRLESGAGARSWKALHSILGNLVFILKMMDVVNH